MLVPLLLLALCAWSQPLHTELLLRASLDTAARGLASDHDPEIAAAAEAWLAIGAGRERVHEAELKILRTGVENALILDELPRAAGLLAASLETMRGEPTLLELRDTVEQAMILAPPTERAQAWIELAEVCRDPEQRAHYLEQSDRAAIESRYEPARITATRAAQAGIQRSAAVAMLERIDREYYVEPDWQTATQAGRRQLGWLVELGLASGPALPPAQGDPVQALDTALAWGVQAQLEPETVIAEWMHGTLAALDPWTRAVWPAELASWQQEHAGVYHGVGLELRAGSRGEVLVARPLLSSPAWSSGIHQGDRVERIDGLTLAEIEGDRLAAAERALQGAAGSTVTLLMHRSGREPFEVTLTRAPIVVETVSGYQRRDDATWDPWLDEDDGLAYVRIDAFKPTTLAAFDALTLPVSERLRGVVIDLRGNPGGDIESAVEIADRFVARGWLIRVDGRVMPETTPSVATPEGVELAEWNEAAPGHRLEGVPVVVLVDTGTASAAELLAGALQARAGAWVVGAPTWGKGRTQALRADPEQGWAVQYTNLVWTLPGGQALDRDLGGGIRPDVHLAMSVGEQYLARRLAHQRAAVHQHADGAPLSWPELGRRYDLPELEADPGILAAELVLRARLSRLAPAPPAPPAAHRSAG
jgi:carboxyl-terminal processing protease